VPPVELPRIVGSCTSAPDSPNQRPGGSLSRREILKGGICAAALFTLKFSVLGCSSSNGSNKAQEGISKVGYSLSGRPLVELQSDARIPIIWIEAGVCTGCAISLLGSVDPGIESVVPLLRLEFQETLMDGSGAMTADRLLEASTELSGKFVLIVEGSVSFDEKADVTVLGATSTGFELNAQALIDQLAQRALAIVALGTCSSFGGIPSAAPNPGGHSSIARLVPSGKPFVRLPGCPPNPAWIIETLGVVMTQGPAALSLDELGRPTSAYGRYIHDICPRRSQYDAGNYASAPGDPTRCLVTVGCKGPSTHADCPRRLWNGRSTCINANHPCVGCASPGFPDARTDAGTEGQTAASPFYLDP